MWSAKIESLWWELSSARPARFYPLRNVILIYSYWIYFEMLAKLEELDGWHEAGVVVGECQEYIFHINLPVVIVLNGRTKYRRLGLNALRLLVPQLFLQVRVLMRLVAACYLRGFLRVHTHWCNIPTLMWHRLFCDEFAIKNVERIHLLFSRWKFFCLSVVVHFIIIVLNN